MKQPSIHDILDYKPMERSWLEKYKVPIFVLLGILFIFSMTMLVRLYIEDEPGPSLRIQQSSPEFQTLEPVEDVDEK